jgi:hypothetical protein
MKALAHVWKIGKLGIVLAVLALVGGCSDGHPKRVQVAGTLTIDGKPLPNAELRLIPAQGRPALATTDSSGHFNLWTFKPGDGAIPGTYTVTVVAYERRNATTLRWLVPRKYELANKSGKTVTIDQPTEDLQIALTWGGTTPEFEHLPAQ